MILYTEDRCMIRKWPVEHSQELHPKSKFLVMTEAYLSTTFGPNLSDFFDFAFIGCPSGDSKIGSYEPKQLGFLKLRIRDKLLVDFCTSESSKNQPSYHKKADGQAFRKAEVQKGTREFSDGLDLQ